MCALFAATYPEKTRALVMIGTYAKRLLGSGVPVGADAKRSARRSIDRSREDGAARSGSRSVRRASRGDPAFRAWWATYLRMGASPGAALALTRMNAEIDIRDILPSIRVPTLVLHRRHDHCLRVEEGRYVASRIPGARLRRAAGRRSPAVCRRSGRDARRDRALRDRRARVEPAGGRSIACSRRSCTSASTASPSARSCSTPRASATGSAAAPLASTTGSSWPRSTGRRARSAAPRRSSTRRRATRVQVRVGLHTGECTIDDDAASGPPVELAAGIAAMRRRQRGPHLPHRLRHRRRRRPAVRGPRRAPDSGAGGVAAVPRVMLAVGWWAGWRLAVGSGHFELS